MLRILAFLLVVLATGIGFAWLADNPGQVSFVWQGQQADMSLMVFIIALGLLLAAVLLVVWLVSAFFRTPGAIGNWWSTRRRDRGYEALSTGIIAAGAGDAVLARRMTKRSNKLLDVQKEPLIRFLDAQTAMIEGDHARARSTFEHMERNPETRLLALRGLFLEAERVGDEGAARHYAERAVRIAPHVPWAGGAVLESKSLAGDWNGALEILEAQKNTRLIDRDESKRLRAVLLTAKAMGAAEGDPETARTAGVEAHKLAPDLVPAGLVAAQALFRLGDLRRGSKILETSWVNNPHPEIAEAYVHARPGDSADDRLKRAQKLHGLRAGHVEAEISLARAALDAGDLKLARSSALAAVEAEPRESVYLLLADIEEEDTGEVGRVREWLARAIRAPRDPAWTADGMVAEHWAPISPVTGRLDAFQWKVPVERIGAEDGPVIEAQAGDRAKTIEAGHEQTVTPVTPPVMPVPASTVSAEKPASDPAPAKPEAGASTEPSSNGAGKHMPAANTGTVEPANGKKKPEALTDEERKEARFA
ncbi:MAG: heme biosynthesis HemY N-terminal domain-containing protein [Aurantimonas endophytica]|uniref:HemY protein n=1 Tax=Aurantimonas endophytica TaxID=1522175 RepID=A0A7W6MQA9_9HYPH|nr:heme biosynthesis HemY N-terminal domain-containing protein [Aurantimonas endophytica]MBB4003783.1 HemY protein [Aurantimonas endophytica]